MILIWYYKAIPSFQHTNILETQQKSFIPMKLSLLL